MKKCFIIILVFLLLFITTAQFVWAAIGVSLYPTSFKLSLNPGQSYNGILTAVNPNDFDIYVKPEKEILAGGAEGSIQLTGEEQNQFGFLSWISFDMENKLVAAKAKHEMPFTISVPQNAQPGDHYASILFRAVPIQKDQITGIGTSGRVGTVILLNVSGDVKKSGEIQEIIVPKFIGHGPLKVSIKINNTGNTFFNPEGKVMINGLFQKNEQSWKPKLIFPNYPRTFDVTWNQKYLFGLFKVTVDASIPGGEAMPAKTAYVWAFPWQDALVVLGIVLILLFVVKKFKGKFKLVRVD